MIDETNEHTFLSMMSLMNGGNIGAYIAIGCGAAVFLLAVILLVSFLMVSEFGNDDLSTVKIVG